jgi:hypothetical protein
MSLRSEQILHEEDAATSNHDTKLPSSLVDRLVEVGNHSISMRFARTPFHALTGLHRLHTKLPSSLVDRLVEVGNHSISMRFARTPFHALTGLHRLHTSPIGTP